MTAITVIGSISNDFVAIVETRPEIGETVEGKKFSVNFGGKGANQAVASARLGVPTSMIGAVGAEHMGDLLIDNLNKNKIATTSVTKVEGVSSGSALITIEQGDNAIIYVPGANNYVGIELIKANYEVLLSSDMVVVQNEIPVETISYIVEFCFQHNLPLLLNPAPARAITPELLEKVTYLTPNESEFKAIFGDEKIEETLAKFPNKLIVTLGSRGVTYHDGTEVVIVPSYRVEEVVDTTGAGDTFNGAFAAATVKGLSILESIQLGNLAASISIQRFGAQDGMPSLEQLKGHEKFEKTWDFK